MNSFDVTSSKTPASVSTTAERARIWRKLGVVTGNRWKIQGKRKKIHFTQITTMTFYKNSMTIPWLELVIISTEELTVSGILVGFVTKGSTSITP